MANADKYIYTFPAIRGIQAGREYYVTMCPMRFIPQFFIFDESNLPPDVRAQRVLNKSRVPQIAQYLIDNPDSYIFSAITASIDTEVKFIPTGDEDSKIGKVEIPMDARFLINDGQHRRAAIERALETKPELGNETISVVLFMDAGLKRSQQMFADLNQHAVRPTKSLRLLYDRRDPWAGLTRKVMQRVAIFEKLTDTEKTSISNRSTNLFTLSNVHQATLRFLGSTGKKNSPPTEEDLEMAVEFWNQVIQHVPEWGQCHREEIPSKELRDTFIHAHGIALQALGAAGNTLMNMQPDTWQKTLGKLSEVDWSRSNTKVWEGRAMTAGRISKAHNNVILTTNFVKKVLKLPLNEKEQEIEQTYLKSRRPSQNG